MVEKGADLAKADAGPTINSSEGAVCEMEEEGGSVILWQTESSYFSGKGES